MPTNPNDPDSKPLPPDGIPPVPPPDEGVLDELPDLDELDLSEFDDDFTDEVPVVALPADDGISFEPPVPTADPGSFTIGVSLDDVTSLEPGELVPEAEALALPGDSVADVGNLEAIAPASGWLDSDVGQFPAPVEVALPVGDSGGGLDDLPVATVESSDIFAGGHVPPANRAESSDVISATAYGEEDEAPRDPEKPGRPSEIALSFDQPPGGSTLQTSSGGDGLPIADELIEAAEILDEPDSLFELPPEGAPFDSSKLADVAELPEAPPAVADADDAPRFGATPAFTPDASSILADLGGDEATLHDESGVRLEAPGMDRTHGMETGEGTEFDLTISAEDIPPELAEAEAASGEPTEWQDQAGSDLFADRQASPQVDLGLGDSGVDDSGQVSPFDPRLTGDQPSLTSAQSSIFTGDSPPATDGGRPSDSGRVPLGVAPEKAEGGSDSSVEFSDHPEAEDEALASRIFGPQTPSRPAGPVPADDLEVVVAAEPEADPAEAVEWNISDVSEEATVGVPLANLDGPLSDLLSKLMEEPGSEEHKGQTISDGRGETPPAEPKPKDANKGGKGAKPAGKPGKLAAKAPSDPSAPSVEIDWLAGSATGEAAVVANEATESTEAASDWESEPPAREPEKARGKGKDKPKEKEKAKPAPAKADRPSPEREPRRSGKGGWVGGTLVGMVLAGGAFAGAYFGGVIPNAEKSAQTPGPVGQKPGTGGNAGNTDPTAPPPPTAADVTAAVRSGDPAKARLLAASLKDETPVGKATLGEAQLFALVQEKADAGIAADNADLKAARANLEALVGDADAAKTPEGERAAIKAAVQLGISHELAGDRDAARKVYEDSLKSFPKAAATFEAALDRLAATAPAAAPPPPDGNTRRLAPADARQLLLAVTLLQAEPAAKADDAEAGVYFWKAVNKAAGEKYAEAIDDIAKAKAAHVKQAKAKAGQGLNPLSDPLEQIFARCCDDLKAYWELRAAVYGNKAVADLVKKDGAAKAMTALADAQKKAADAVVLMANLKDATDKLTVAAKDLKDAKDLVAKLETDVKDADSAKLAVEKKLEGEEKARKTADTLVASLATELQSVKLLPEKYDAAELLAAQKRAADRAVGPNLSTLLSPGMIAVGGAGLSTGQLVDIAERLGKSELTAKVATEKLATEVKRLASEHAAEVKKITDGHATEVKKLTDGYAADMKKLTDTHATNVAKLKDDQVAELKAMADKYTADAKKLTEGFEGKIKNLELIATKEKERGEALAAKFKQDIANAITPAEGLDLWLPVLVELRRPADADGALANAAKVLASAPADSEEAAKARTVAGLASLFKNDLTVAKLQFQAAKSNPTYEAARKANRLWARAADVGLASVTDSLAPFRKPAELPKRDPVLASRYLDTGVKAYKEARYTDAVTAFTDATKADATDPVAWYFLGASKWALGATDAAEDDFRQGAVREAASNVPSRTIGAALAPIQGTGRDALTTARP